MAGNLWDIFNPAKMEENAREIDKEENTFKPRVNEFTDIRKKDTSGQAAKANLLSNSQMAGATGRVNVGEAFQNLKANVESAAALSAYDTGLAGGQNLAANLTSALQGAAAASGRGSVGSSNPNQAYIDQLNSIYQQIMDRGPWDKEFQYDLNGDALYKQYADQYARMGQQAMQDTVAEASALTGGYGNSWAATAGSQAYQDYLGQLNSIVPTLQQQAYDQYLADYDRWNDETNRLLTLYDLTAAHPGVVSALKPSYGGGSSKSAADVATDDSDKETSPLDYAEYIATFVPGVTKTQKELQDGIKKMKKKQ